MNLLKPFYRLAGGKRAGTEPCPSEAQILAFVQDGVTAPMRKVMERHLAYCDRCRELSADAFNSLADNLDDAACQHLSGRELNNQVARVLNYIELDDQRQAERPEGVEPSQPALKPARGFFLSYPQLASASLVFCAVVGGIVYWATRSESPYEMANTAITRAMVESKVRRIKPRISGDLPHAEHTEPRGAGDEHDAHLNSAREKLESEENSSDPDAQLALARLYLASGTSAQVKRARGILEKMEAAGIKSAEFLNDLGVAYYLAHRHANAIIYYNRALEMDPGFSEALYNRALAYEGNNQIDEARRDWKRFINGPNDEDWKQEAQYWLDRMDGKQ